VRILDQRAQARAADLTAARARLAAARSAHARQTALAAKGHATQRAVDDAAAELAVWTQRAEALKAEIALIEEERRQAANGLYLSDGRMGAAYAHVRGDEVAIRMLELSTRLEGVRARRDELGLQVALEEERVRHVAASRLEAPFDGVVWKVLAAENGAVGAGSGMIQMIDCESTYLEVQVSERRFERVAAGDPLYYRLLGEEHWRTGQVAALRGGGVHQDAITLAAGLEESGGLRVMASFAADHQPGQAAFCDVGRRVEVRFGTPDAGAAMTQLVQRARGLLDAGFAMVIPTAQAAARHISSLVE
jgi:multidrug resistance efflux pump